ncbi:MAG: redox-sensing transcriptional repressor Rex [Lachnospiraceae bacterium]|nr:redox-sensing transcriptional repressor Rex [Lachnospiraceae bacterium]
MMETKISKAVIRRLPRYYRYLGDLLNNKVERISSNELSDKMKLTASQIRQDLNNFGGFGQQGYGYNVRYLHDEIGKILGLNETHNMIIIGAGNLASAIVRYDKFEQLGFPTIGMFDVNKDLFGTTINGIKVYSIDELDDFVKNNQIDIAALTLPKENAIEVANRLVSLGVKSIWNFTHIDLELNDDDVVIENVHLSDSLMRLSYEIASREKMTD